MARRWSTSTDAGPDLLLADLGQEHARLTLGRTTTAWVTIGSALRDHVSSVLDGSGAAGVEHIGSSAVVGLLAKPIVDLAVGARDEDFSRVHHRLEDDGWIYRGDAGDDGGHVFVLETAPAFRVAHLHVVEPGGDQWRRYLRLRDVLRRSAEARARYESVKLRLLDEVGDDRAAYTDGKSEVVDDLLAR